MRVRSLIPCIITHIFINALSIFGRDAKGASLYLMPLILIVVSVSYTIYINKIVSE